MLGLKIKGRARWKVSVRLQWARPGKDPLWGRLPHKPGALGVDPVTFFSANTIRNRVKRLRAACDFKRRMDTARFCSSLDGRTWTRLGNPLKLHSSNPPLMGYRFGRVACATQTRAAKQTPTSGALASQLAP